VLYLFKLGFQSCFQGIKQCTIREENWMFLIFTCWNSLYSVPLKETLVSILPSFVLSTVGLSFLIFVASWRIYYKENNTWNVYIATFWVVLVSSLVVWKLESVFLISLWSWVGRSFFIWDRESVIDLKFGLRLFLELASVDRG
jgi:hypothetical protein